MMKLMAIVVGGAIALSTGVSISSQSEISGSPLAVGIAKTAFHHPKVDGTNLDTRFMAHMKPSATQVAERFCLDHGYGAVSDFAVRPSAMTMTISDGQSHATAERVGQTFSYIECVTPEIIVAGTNS